MGRRTGALLALAALARILAAGRAHAGDLAGRAILSYQKLDTDVFRTDGFHQTYDLRLQRFVLPTLQVRASFRGERNDGHAAFGETEMTNAFWQMQPGGEILYLLPKLQVQATWDLFRSGSSNGLVAGSQRRLERSVGRLSWRPDDLPALTLQAERRGSSDQASELAITETLLYGGLDWSWKGLRASETNRYTSLRDGRVGFSRESLETQGQLAWDGATWNGRLAASASVLGSWTRLDESATGSTGALVPTQVPVTTAGNAIDDTPLDGRDRPLVENPALKDGNLEASAGISIGPDGELYQNVGVDLTRVVALDELRIHVRSASGELVPLGGPVRWDVYVSGDGVTWRPLPGGARTAFEVPLSRYEVSFPSTASRWFKVVGFGLNSVDTRITEVEAYYHTALESEETRRTSIRLANASAAVSARPFDALLLTYHALFNSVSQEPEGKVGISTRDSDQIVSAEVFPWRRLSFLARYEARSLSQSSDLTQRYRAVTGILRYAMGRSLDVSLEALSTDEDNAGIESRTTGLTLHTYARLLPTLEVSADVGSQRQRFEADGRSADRLFVSGVSIAQLTTTLKLTLQATIQRSRFAQPADLEPQPDARDERTAAELFFRPSQQLALTARFGYARGERVSGATQRYRVEWFPFPGGSLSLGGTYDQDVEPASQRRSKRVMLTPRWTVNRHAVLDLNYALLEVTGFPSTSTKILSTNLTLTF